MRVSLVCGAAHDARRAWASRWLTAWGATRPCWIVASHLAAADQLVRAQDQTASFGWQRHTYQSAAIELARPLLAEHRRYPAARWAREALLLRVLRSLQHADELRRLAPVTPRPALAARLLDTLEALDMAEVGDAALQGHDPELGHLRDAFRAAMAQQRCAGPAETLQLAIAALQTGRRSLAGTAVLVWDLPVHDALTARWVEALAVHAEQFGASVAFGDTRSERGYRRALGVTASPCDRPSLWDSALRRLQHHLFEPRAPTGDADPSVRILSAPSEAAECLEIARSIRQQAARGVAFDRMAVFLRAPSLYRPYLADALARADVPAHFAQGCGRAHAGGRALVALLRCALGQLSAQAFADYWALGIHPPPCEGPEAESGLPAAQPDPPLPLGWEKRIERSSRAPGLDRWRAGFAALEAQSAAARPTVVGSPPRPLEKLRLAALPLLERLASLPAQAPWSGWLDALRALAVHAIREPQPVLAALAELSPLAELGPVTLSEVLTLIEHRLADDDDAANGSPAGRVYVAPVGDARGMVFDHVWVPGLAERIFPARVAEDPVLKDAARRRIDAHLPTNPERILAERLALRLAVGAARCAVTLSYPRLDSQRARPRVPSFYGLEVLRAVEGRVPDFEALRQRAGDSAGLGLGRPAPRLPEDAVDTPEFDLAVLAGCLALPEDRARGAARYLVGTNAHLARALRFRARRWQPRWCASDGLVQPDEGARESLAKHHPSARSYDAGSLEIFVGCPYRFFLEEVVGLAVPARGGTVDGGMATAAARARTAEGGLAAVAADADNLRREAFENGFFPAAPPDGACETCPHLPLCGPREAERAARKAGSALRALERLRRSRR